MDSRTSDVESLEATELRLGLPGTEKLVSTTSTSTRGNKRASPDSEECKLRTGCAHQETGPPPAKAQVVGWPPVRSFRRNTIQAKNKAETTETSQGHFVKVSMDGAPYLRKIDLNIYKGYKELRHGLETMFKSFSTGEISGLENESESSIAYEDKDGDLMLAGDVPWEMFTSSCKRLRVMKGSEAKGLTPSL